MGLDLSRLPLLNVFCLPVSCHMAGNLGHRYLAANLLVNHGNEILASYWLAVSMPNRDTKTNMASRMRRKRSVAFSGLNCLITADCYGLFRFRLLVIKLFVIFPVKWFSLSRLFCIFAAQKPERVGSLPFFLYF